VAGSSSISGLVSGLDTATIISQLMKIEAQPQTLLKSKLGAEQTNVSSLQSLNAKLAALTTKAADLASSTAWSFLAATSSSTSVTATAGPAAVAGRLSLTVDRTASAHALTFSATAAGADVVTTGSTKVRLDRLDGTTVDLETGNGTLDGLVTALNASGTGVSATKVRLDDGSYRLRVVSASTGEDSDFTLTNTDGSDLLGGAAVTAGQDAAITVGTDTIHSATNTFAGLSPGLDVTIAPGTAAGTVVDVTVARDAKAAQSAVQGLVDSANEILDAIDKLTAYDSVTKKSAALAGDATLRNLRNSVLDTVTRAADGSTMAGLGVQTDRYGNITFDTAKFATAFADDPAAVSAKLGAPSVATVPGFAARLQAVAKAASDSVTGSLTTNIVGRQSTVSSMQDKIDDWDVRLTAREAALTKQYAALEVSLGKLQDQSSWLTSQIAGLPSYSKS
jgi:flagellar hook-associated protein 2